MVKDMKIGKSVLFGLVIVKTGSKPVNQLFRN